jgi:hypothetical protein
MHLGVSTVSLGAQIKMLQLVLNLGFAYPKRNEHTPNIYIKFCFV